MKSKPTCLILCGGFSSRMKQPKHLLKFGEFRLWEIQKQKAESAGFEVIISCRVDQLEHFVNVRTIADKHIEIGPMGGILSALEILNQEAFLVLSCDVPNIRIETLKNLWARNTQERMAYCAIQKGSIYPEPLVAVWNKSAYIPLLKAKNHESYSLIKVLSSNSYGALDVDPIELTNLNTIEDLMSFKGRQVNQQ